MEIFLGLFIILVVARIFGEAAAWLNLPSVLGELVGGVLLGIIILLGLEPLPVFPIITENPVFVAIENMSIFLLMFTSGMEVRLNQLLQNAKQGIWVAVGGVVVPIGLGIGIGILFIPPSNSQLTQVIFLGIVISITAVAVGIRTLMDIGSLNSRVGSVIVDAAVADDIIGIVLLAVLVSMINTGHFPPASELAWLFGKVGAYFAISAVIGLLALQRLDRYLPKTRAPEMHFTILLIIGLGMAIISELLGIHFMVGAFTAGLLVRAKMALSTKIVVEEEEKFKAGTIGLFAPIFFGSRGLHLNLAAFGVALPFTLALLGAAIVGKFAGCSVPAKLMGIPLKESLAIGTGMNSRGGVELVIASVALKAGMFNQPQPVPDVVAAMFSSVVIMAIGSSLIVPVGLRILLGNTEPITDTGDQQQG